MDKAVQLTHTGGTYGGQRKPTNFMCLLLKLLQLQPEKEIIVEFIKNEDYKYVRLLGELLPCFGHQYPLHTRSRLYDCLIGIDQ